MISINTNKNSKSTLKLIVKLLLKTLIPARKRKRMHLVKTKMKKYSVRDVITKYKIYEDEKPFSVDSAKLYQKMFVESNIIYVYNYLYTFDPLKERIKSVDTRHLASITADYRVVIRSNLDEIRQRLNFHKGTNNIFVQYMMGIISAVEQKAESIAKKTPSCEREKYLISLFPNLLYRDCLTFDECLQKILFYNGLLWQSGHSHNGLGRLDYLLYTYYLNDITTGIETYESAKSKLKDFCLVLGYQSYDKSLSLIGDTGQYILLGGIDEHGDNVDNELTRMFLEIFTEIKVPDPKLIFRENKETPEDTWMRCIKCLLNGCGSPLFMNEQLIMDNMVKFGYSKDDVWNLGTSACWEPLIIGKSSCQNNPFPSIVAYNALVNVLNKKNDYASFCFLFEAVKKELTLLSPKQVQDFDFDYAPIYTLFDTDSLRKGKDFAHKGSKYMYQGAQVLSLPNLVNSLMNIKEYVYDKHIVSLNDCCDIIDHNYEGREDLWQLFHSASGERFGSSTPDVLNITNELIVCISKALESVFSNGEPIKFGLSSPNYVDQAVNTPASLDGRKAGEPYAVHISPVSSSIDINEIIQFACNLHYPYNCLNGNVVDFIISTSYQKTPDKLVSIIKNAFNHGLYQMQLNVLDKQILIDAKAHPEKYPNLVVRVWGFSAYFNDLPDSYKDNLIARSETYEFA